MDNSVTPAKAIKLGNELVKVLDLEPGGNTLTRWMVHYLAEQLTAAETMQGPAKAAAEERCFQTVLALWEHRRDLPTGRRPFEDFEPILHTLERLNPDKPTSFFHRLPKNAEAIAGKEKAEVLKLMKFVEGLDVAARILMELALESAAGKAASEGTRVMLREALPGKTDVDVKVVRRLLKKSESPQEPSKDENVRLLERRLEQLDLFLEVCQSVRVGYTTELKTLRKQSKKPNAKK